MILAQIGESSYNMAMAHERILVVDDDREITRLLRSYLEQAGYVVLTAHTGETAIHALRRGRPDLLILDLMLPDRDGWDVTRVIRADAKLAATHPITNLSFHPRWYSYVGFYMEKSAAANHRASSPPRVDTDGSSSVVCHLWRHRGDAIHERSGLS